MGGIIGSLGVGGLKIQGVILDVALLLKKFQMFWVSNWGATPILIENEVVSSAMGGIIGRLGVGGLKTQGVVLDVALLLKTLKGFWVSSWGATPIFIENEVVSSAMGGITGRLGVGGLKT